MEHTIKLHENFKGAPGVFASMVGTVQWRCTCGWRSIAYLPSFPNGRPDTEKIEEALNEKIRHQNDPEGE
jgi:hypothetical protein